MLTQIKSILKSSHETLLQDAMGAAALAVMLVVGLHLPAFT